MGNLVKTDIVSSFVSEIENKDLLYISYEKEIPSANNYTSFEIKVDSNGRIRVDSTKHHTPDPSTIYLNLPISEDYNTPPLGYYPHYINMTSGQRFKYLNWLRNVDLHIDIGYVFIYYYGLEKQMITGNFEKAFNQIIRLRNHHENKSFQTYSQNALIYGCLANDRLDLLWKLPSRTHITGCSNEMLNIIYHTGFGLTVSQIVDICYSAFPKSRKAITEDREFFASFAQEQYDVLFPQEGIKLSDYNINSTRKIISHRFANYSFPQIVRHTQITDFYQCAPFMKDIERIFDPAYNALKEKRALDRKVDKTKISPEEIKMKKQNTRINHYKKLLKNKHITQREFDILMNSIKY